jgi:hypothetical protein
MEKSICENTWKENRKLLENLLKLHHLPVLEIKQILSKYDESFKNNDTRGMVGCIDDALSWDYSTFTYDFYHFLQIRFAYYMCFYSSNFEERRVLLEYLSSLLSGYRNHPTTVRESCIPERRKSGDLILTEENYRIRKNYLKAKTKKLLEKFGL